MDLYNGLSLTTQRWHSMTTAIGWRFYWAPAFAPGAPRINVSEITLGAASNVRFAIWALSEAPVPQPTESIISRVHSTASSAVSTLSGGRGVLRGYRLSNNYPSARYVKIYKDDNAVVGTDVPVMTIMVPAASSISDQGLKIDFEPGLQYAITTGLADSDTTAPGSNEMSGYFLHL